MASPRNGYVVYPGSYGFMSLRRANAEAKKESLRDGHARVENADTGRTVATWSYGKKVQANPRQGAHRVRRVSKTGWLKAKAVRIVRQKGRTVVQIKRASKRRQR